MRALTLIRPWDEPIVDGVKTVENRSWKPPDDVIGTYIAIHAGAKYSSADADSIEKVGGYVTLPAHESDRVRRMAVVGVARVAGWVHGHVGMGAKPVRRLFDYGNSLEQRSVMDVVLSLWFRGPIGWALDKAVSIAPVPCRGRQKLWALPADVELVVRERWTHELAKRCPSCGGRDVDNVGDGLTALCMGADCGREWRPAEVTGWAG